MEYLFSTTVFLAVILTLVGLLLVVESRVTVKGDRIIVINDDEDKGITTPGTRRCWRPCWTTGF